MGLNELYTNNAKEIVNLTIIDSTTDEILGLTVALEKLCADIIEEGTFEDVGRARLMLLGLNAVKSITYRIAPCSPGGEA